MFDYLHHLGSIGVMLQRALAYSGFRTEACIWLLMLTAIQSYMSRLHVLRPASSDGRSWEVGQMYVLRSGLYHCQFCVGKWAKLIFL